MSDTPSKLFAVLAVLLGVWVLTYWLYEPTSASTSTPKVTLDPRISEVPPSPVPPDPVSGQGAAGGGKASGGGEVATLREPQLPLPPLPGPATTQQPVKTRRVQKMLAPQWRTYVVQRGDTGWKAVAARKEVFGDAAKWQVVARSNPLVSPDRLKPGKTELRIPLDPENIQGKLVWVDEPIPDEPAAPPAPPPTAPASPAKQTYTITREDTLWEISKRFYGKGASWRLIYDANKSLIPDPDRPPAGVTITIPPQP